MFDVFRRYPERTYRYNTNPENPEDYNPGNPEDPPISRQVHNIYVIYLYIWRKIVQLKTLLSFYCITYFTHSSLSLVSIETYRNLGNSRKKIKDWNSILPVQNNCLYAYLLKPKRIPSMKGEITAKASRLRKKNNLFICVSAYWNWIRRRKGGGGILRDNNQ